MIQGRGSPPGLVAPGFGFLPMDVCDRPGGSGQRPVHIIMCKPPTVPQARHQVNSFQPHHRRPTPGDPDP
jgi:hypothetical protein